MISQQVIVKGVLISLAVGASAGLMSMISNCPDAPPPTPHLANFNPSKYERILLTQLRNTETSTHKFRKISTKLADLLVNKVIECLPTKAIEIETPVAKCTGEELAATIELVSIMRSGDALIDPFIQHFPKANISKLLIQRDEITAKPHFKYMKLSPTIASGNYVVITEPMIATGGSLDMTLTLLKEAGVSENRIIIASICVAPEGVMRLNQKFPEVQIVAMALDEKLNDVNYIVPGLGDFGDRFFGS